MGYIKKQKIIKLRKFEIVERDEQKAKQIINQILKDYNEGYIKEYAYAVHDKDRYTREDIENAPEGKKIGDLKTKHYHIGFVVFTPKTIGTIATRYKEVSNMINKVKSKFFIDYLAYLTHANAPDKYQYDDSIVSTSMDNWQKERNIAVQNRQADQDLKWVEKNKVRLIQDIRYGNISLYDMNHDDKLGMLYWNYKSKCDAALGMASRIKERYRGVGNEKKIYYIEGKSGTGKTTYAENYFIQRNIPYYTSAPNKDMFDGYTGEKGILLDDVRPTNLPFNEWLRLLDQLRDTSITSRYFNKLITADVIILTAPISIFDFMNGFKKRIEQEEDKTQFYRRITKRIVITNNGRTEYKYNMAKDEWIKVNTIYYLGTSLSTVK